MKILVFNKIVWCIVAFCTGASGVSYCQNDDLVIRKFDCEIIVDGWGCVFDRGQYDSNAELEEVAQESKDGYYSVKVYFSSQFIPYIYQSTMKVATCYSPVGWNFGIILYFGRNM